MSESPAPVWLVDYEDKKLRVQVLKLCTDQSIYNLGYITLDFKYRCWDTGSCALGLRTRTAAMRQAKVGSYEGTGWKKRMIEDAKAYLLNLVKENTPCT